MKKYICLAWSIACLASPHNAMAGGATEVDAVGESQFYYSRDADEIARHEANGAMGDICGKRGTKLYQGDYVPHSPAFTYTLVKYDKAECLERNGNKKCTVHAKAYCVPNDSLYFSVQCTEKKSLKGKFIALGGNSGFQMLTNTGQLFTFNTGDLAGVSGKTIVSTMCQGESDVSVRYKKVLRYVQQRIEEHRSNCTHKVERHQKNSNVKVPDSCDGAPQRQTQPGASRG